MNLLQVFVLTIVIESTISGGPTKCDEVRNSFLKFEEIWLRFVDDAREFALNNSASYPILTLAFTKDLSGEAQMALRIAANATSRLSGFKPVVLFDFFRNNTNLPFGTKLDCISKDLTYMRDKISHIVVKDVPLLKASAPKQKGPPMSCFKSYVTMVSYIPTGLSIISTKSSMLTNASAEFLSINMLDLFLDAFISVRNETWDVVGTSLGSVLNANPDPLIAYLKGNSSTLSDPYSCLKNLVDLLKTFLSSFLDNLSVGLPVNLQVPSIPPFF